MRARWGFLLSGVAAGVAAGVTWSAAGSDAGHQAQAATSTATVIFGGLTAQREPVIVEVNPARTRVVKIIWEWRAKCSLGPAAPPDTPLTTAWSDSAQRFVIKGGRWAGKYTAGPFTDPTTGIVQKFTYALSGVLRPGAKMAGQIRTTYEESSPAGVIRTCNSGAVGFTIRD